LAHPNDLGAPLVFLVKRVDGNWLEAMLPIRPNGITGWIQSSDVTLSETEWRARVELGAHLLTVWRGTDVVTEVPVAVGTPSAPTPTGDYYLTELLETGNPDGAYGPYAFGLSSYSDVYTEFAGGPGQVGLHGTNAPEALGTDISHGCIRVDNATITDLAFKLPVGSPITVTA
jgi:lipoprotein-anchoring transpeptidase ErfK/SrfK